MESETHETLLNLIQSDDLDSNIKAAKEIRRLTKTSHRCRQRFSAAVPTLVAMLRSDSVEANEVALLALLNLAVKDEALLTMCEKDRNKYRELILKEGVIPGLLELTVQGTPKSQIKAKTLLRLLRESPYPRSELQGDTLENIVCNILYRIDGEDQSGKAKKMLAEMVQVSMEQSLRHLQQRAIVCTPADLPIKVPLE